MSRPTDSWLAAGRSVMEPLEGPAGVAERLLLLLHYGIAWESGWVGQYRRTYWSQILPSRVIAATYRTDELRGWWQLVCEQLEASPRRREEREEVVSLLQADSQPVLECLRSQAEALILRTQITTDFVRNHRGTAA